MLPPSITPATTPPPPRTPATRRALGAFVKLVRAAESVAARSHTCLPPGLTFAQFGVLEALLHCGPLCQSELAAKVLKSPANLTLVVDNLERDGHVRRERDATDRRFIRVHLTRPGRTLIENLFPQIAAAITREFSPLTAPEQTTLATLLRKLGRPTPSKTP